MRRGLYRTMALMNIKRGSKYYIPFLITILLTAAMFFNMFSVSENSTIINDSGAIASVLKMGVSIVGIFSVIFIFYTNSFLMKRRTKELGLYYILGMEKKHIARILAWETGLLGFVGVLLGIAFGLLLDRALYLLLLRLFHYPIVTGYEFSADAMIATTFLFCLIFILVLISNLIRLRNAKAVDLLSSDRTGEKEPKTRWLIALIGLALVGYGYYLAITTKYSFEALKVFFEAVLLVMLGTYCLFYAGSIALLKMLKKRKSYYYRENHFIAVSSMIYRMKRNAVGLANICILSTGVLLVISTTVCLYTGMRDIMHARFPADIVVELKNSSGEQEEALEEIVWQTSDELALPVTIRQPYRELSVSMLLENGEFVAPHEGYRWEDICYLTFLTAKGYEDLCGKSVALGKNEVLVYEQNGKTEDNVTLLGMEFQVKEHMQSLESEGAQSMEDYMFGHMMDAFMFIVSDDEVLRQIYERQAQAYEEQASKISYQFYFDVKGSAEEEKLFANTLTEKLEPLRELGQDKSFDIYSECREANAEDFYGLYGSMLFLGIFLGTLFLMATILIIYYKQLMEGYEDKNRYAILKKVGMDDRSVKRTVNSQVVTLFFLPLLAAVVHIAAAFPLMTSVLQALNMYNDEYFLVCTAATVLVFSVAYLVIYRVTARIYYKIVSV